MTFAMLPRAGFSEEIRRVPVFSGSDERQWEKEGKCFFVHILQNRNSLCGKFGRYVLR
jgi:hypothetical protein